MNRNYVFCLLAMPLFLLLGMPSLVLVLGVSLWHNLGLANLAAGISLNPPEEAFSMPAVISGS